MRELRDLIGHWARAAREWFSIPDVVPQTPERNAMVFVFKAVLALWLLPVAIGGEAPRSLEQSPAWMTLGAPWAVIIGSAISIVGLTLRDRDDGIDLEQVGLVLVGVGLLIYGTAVFTGANLTQARWAAGICFGLGLGAGARWWQMQRYQVSKRREATRGPT